MTTIDDPPDRLEFLKGTMEVLIPGSLQMTPKPALGIAKFVEQQAEEEFSVDNGTLHPGVKGLVQKGWISSRWRTSPNARRAKYYRLTPDGKKQLLMATFLWQRFVEPMSCMLAPEAK